MADNPGMGDASPERPLEAREVDGARFRELLFGRVPAEDVAPYSSETLTEIAGAAFSHLERARPAGRPSVELRDLTAARNGRSRDLTVLEVVNDDMPFLLDSTLARLGMRGLEALLVAHPIFAVERREDATLARVAGEATTVVPAGDRRESLIHIHLDRIEGEDARRSLLEDLRKTYADVAAVDRDSETMRAQLAGLVNEYRSHPPPLPEAEREEAIALLEWLSEQRFMLLGMRASRIPEDGGAPQPHEGSGLGLLADPEVHVLKRGAELVSITPEIRAFLQEPQALIVTKSSVRSRVHHPGYLDYVGVKLFTPSGRVWGELAIVGLFTGAAYNSPVESVPYLRRKVGAVLAKAGFDPESFASRALLERLETYPRDELFQIDEATLYDFGLELLRLTEHPRLRVLARADRFDRFVSVIVYLPKERFEPLAQRRIGEFLARIYGGRLSAAYPAYPAGPLARIHYIIGRDGSGAPEVSRDVLESGIAAITRNWADRLGEALADSVGGSRGRELAARWGGAFGAAYREAYDPAVALGDIERLERLSAARPRAVDFYRRETDPETRLNLKLFSRGAALPLSERVPLLERMGFRVINERTYRVTPAGGEPETIWLHDMTLERSSGRPVDIASVDARIEATLLAVFDGLNEVDGFNKLVLEAGLTWPEAAAMRAFGRYLRQIVIPFGQEYLADVLARHGEIAASLMALFHARFDPTRDGDGRAEAEREARRLVEERLGLVTSLDEDRILRRFLNLIEAAVRTNFHHGEGGEPPPAIAFKFEAAKVDGMPRPRPRFEIFMNGPRVEAVHLRFGKVARGGLRWTDRPQDFRTEVLGLVKAQQVKNAVIVPVGAKGGFFPKRLPAPSDRAAWLAEGTDAYRLFVGTMLDLTDNLDGDKVAPPPHTVRHDGDDPYLVVAADKGTATFSDLANAISIERGFWLGDAFASGGSNGYDHKAMGITARGAWEAVKRHFREVDSDIQREPVTVVGVGDMSGDVFGNGMMLSRSLKLVAAFDHRDIFIDPDPDPGASWAERKRLFGLPRSSWQDYDKSLISTGGGVYPRGAKSVPLSPEAQAALGFDRDEATPAEVMNAILKAPVGLLWFGGIGTYVRASDETDLQVGDRANDAIRVTGAEIRAKVVGEGANLGMTQRGRVEAARRGVRLNTDAIDNSAGVNTSDVEVNIKIALSMPERDGRLDPASRNALLAEMTDEVAGLVLRNNYLQTLSLSLSERRGAANLGFMSRLMATLEASGRLDRGLEFLPDEAALTARRQAGEGLTRPELAVLLAYAKLALYDELLSSTVPDDPYLGRELERYFPAPIRERFPDAVAHHRLRREIISTQLANAIVNRGGPAVVTRLVDDTGADATTIAAAYAATRDSFGLLELNNGIDALDGTISGARQLDLYAAVQELMWSRIVWFIRNVDFKQRRLDDVVGQYRTGIAEVAASLEKALPETDRAAWATRTAALVAEGVPEDLGGRLAGLQDLVDAPDLVLVARRAERPIAEVAAVHFALGALFRFGGLNEAASAIPVNDHYDRLARDRAVAAVAAAHRALTAEVLARGGDLPAWQAGRGGEVERIRSAVDGMVASGLTVSKLTVAASLIGDLAKA